MKKSQSVLLMCLFFAFHFELCAAVITVNTNGSGLGTNQFCTIRAAIRAAEADAPFSACSAGSGEDTIILPEAVTIVLNQVDYDGIGNNALPRITTAITIEGNDSTLRIADSAERMRFFTVNEVSDNQIGQLTLNNLTLQNGDVDGSGGAISNNGILNLNYVRLENNQASFEGGALSCYESQAVCHVTSSLIINNAASYAGAIIIDLNAELLLDRTTVSGNQATIGNGAADGGSVYVESGHALIINSTITNNQATRYGGLFAASSDLPFSSPGFIDVYYSTIANNIPIGVVGNVTIKNSVLSANDGGNCRITNSITSDGYNHSDDNSCGFASTGDVEGVDVMLEPLETVNAYQQTYRLNYLSPAIDAADPADCVDEDQTGKTRPRDGNNDGSARCDKGSIEMVNNIIFSNSFD